ncbi:MAG: CPBP family intramembrane metalloprotease [Cardiobacteriaceae bacterium]|nr:CPBP family intramembrane metalloprotease [Cardiobacteriaceae bacterium]
MNGFTDKSLRYLTILDVLILTTIFFGSAIISSHLGYVQLQESVAEAPTDWLLMEGNHWQSIGEECLWLVLAFGYLYWRKFDWRHFDFSVDKQSALKTVIYVLLAGTVATLYEYAQAWVHFGLFPEQYPTEIGEGLATEGSAEVMNEAAGLPWDYWTGSFILFALLNGFFEELFFLGVVFAVKPKALPYMVVFSLLVRFSFHTYQGIMGALTITTLGITFALLRYRYRQLLPFMWAHSVFDLVGLVLPFYLLWN